jgi:O-antigen/teichoic acid export membrane protein
MFKKIINSKLVSSSAVYLFSNILAAAIPFALLPVLTRYLTPAEYGQVAIFQTLIVALGAFLGIGAHGCAGVKYYDNDVSKEEFKYFIGNCFLVLGASALLVLCVALVARHALVAWLGIDFYLILGSILTASAIFVITVRMGQWQVRKQAKRYGLFQVSQGFFNMLLSLVLVVYLAQGAQGRLLVLGVVPLLYAAIALFFLQRDGLLGFAWRPGHLREILTFGIPLIPHTVGFFLLSSVDRFVINGRLGMDQVGIYMVAVQLVSVMALVFDAINNAYVPWLFERLKRDVAAEKLQIVRGTYAYCLGLLALVALAFLIGPSVLIFIAGEKYAPAAEVVGWLALGQAFNGMYLMVTNYIFYSKRTGWLSLSTVSAGLINVGLLLLLIPYMGLTGAAIAFAVSMAIKFFLTWYIAQLRHSMPWFDFRYSS